MQLAMDASSTGFRSRTDILQCPKVCMLRQLSTQRCCLVLLCLCSRDFTALHLPELFRYYHALPRQHSQPGIPSWLREHPQKLLPPTGYVSGRLGGVLDLFQYDSRDGFVGIAANLMCLNQQQLGLDVTVNARRSEYRLVLYGLNVGYKTIPCHVPNHGITSCGTHSTVSSPRWPTCN